MKSTTFFATLSALAATVSAGTISCSTTNLNGGRGNVPAHNIVYNLYPQEATYYCAAQLEACPEIADNPDSFTNDYVNCISDGQPDQQAAVSIAYDGSQYVWTISVQGYPTYTCDSGDAYSCRF